MSDTLKLARPYLVLLAICAAGRLLQGALGVPYAKGHHVFSIVILTSTSCLYYGIFLRRLASFRLMQSMGMGFTLGLISQLVIFTLTLLSYVLSIDTYFNHPIALNALDPTQAVPFGTAMLTRVGGLIANSIVAGIAGALGWSLGGLLPEHLHAPEGRGPGLSPS